MLQEYKCYKGLRFQNYFLRTQGPVEVGGLFGVGEDVGGDGRFVPEAVALHDSHNRKRQPASAYEAPHVSHADDEDAAGERGRAGVAVDIGGGDAVVVAPPAGAGARRKTDWR